MKIYNVKIITMDGGKVIDNGWVEITDGKIDGVTAGMPDNIIQSEDIDGMGGTLIPGFIDPHTHLGIIENGIDFEGDDCNEATDPFMPHLRAIDGINPFDKCFEEACARGITTAVICPGSAAPCGGGIAACKTHGRRIDDMLIRNVGIKFALGENPKHVFNEREETPITRMGTAAVIREGLFKAKKYLSQIEAFANDPDENDEPEFDMKSEALVPLLKGKITAHFHCHRADDMFTAMRIAKEFNLKYVLVHATEGYLVADILGNENSKVISGPVICDRCKPEMKGLDLKNTAELTRAGVLTSVCTDHPVIPIQYLPMSAAMTTKGGLSLQQALESITLNAAKTAGIDDVTGSVTVGKDADLQLYKAGCLPLDMLSEPQLVMINGEIVVNKM